MGKESIVPTASYAGPEYDESKTIEVDLDKISISNPEYVTNKAVGVEVDKIAKKAIEVDLAISNHESLSEEEKENNYSDSGEYLEGQLITEKVPTCRGWPFIGNAMEFMKDPLNFIRQQQKIYGDIFRIHLGKRSFVFVLDPECVYGIEKEKAHLRIQIGEVVLSRLFNLSSKDCAFYMSRSNYQLDIKSTYLNRNHLADMMTRLIDHNILNEAFEKFVFKEAHDSLTCDSEGWAEIDLFDRMKQLVFFTAARAIFSKELNLDDYKALDIWQQKTGELAMGVPFVTWEACRQRDKLQKSIGKFRAFTDDFSPMLQESLDKSVARFMQTLGSYESAREVQLQGRSLIEGQLWLLNINFAPSMFWCVFHTAQDKEAVDAIRNEAKKYGSLHDIKDGLEGPKAGSALRIIDSCYNESIRLHGTTPILRNAVDDFELKWENRGAEAGKKTRGPYKINKGDTIVYLQYYNHMNEDIFEEPEKFRFNRFLPDENGKEPKFYNKYKSEISTSLLNFGFGKHKCFGRIVVDRVMKLVLSALFTRYELKVLGGEEQGKPGVDLSEHLTGNFMVSTMYPKHKVICKVRRRENPHL